MKYICFAIIPFMVGLLMPTIFGLIKINNQKRESKMNDKDFVICLSIKWSLLMIIFSVFLAIVLIALNLFESSNLAANIICPIFISFFLFGGFACVRKKIIIKDNDIFVTHIFGKTKKYTFDEIKKIKENSWSNGTISYSVYGKKKLFSITDSLIGYNLFLKNIIQREIYIETIDEQIKARKNK